MCFILYVFAACFSRGLMLCPTSLYLGNVECIREDMLCDESTDCSKGEDEDAELCYFFRLVKNFESSSLVHIVATYQLCYIS